MPTQIAQAAGIHPHFANTDTPIGVDTQGTRWAISFQGRNAIMVATFAPGAAIEFKIPTDQTGGSKSGSVAAFTIPNFGNGRWVTHAEHVKFEVTFPVPPKVTQVSMNIARQNCAVVSDGQGGLDVFSGATRVGALPRPWIEYTPDGAEGRTRLWLDWAVSEPTMSLSMPTLTATEWATAVLDPTVITTSTASTATAYSNQRKLDRCQNGVLWSMFWDGTSTTTTSMDFYYSTDNGSTWTKGGEFGFAGTGTGYVPNGSFFIDLDDYAHVVYKDRHDGFPYYRRGTPNAGRTAWTWSAAQLVVNVATYSNPDIVAHREGSGWVAHIVLDRAEATFDRVVYNTVAVSSGGALTVGAAASLTANYGNTVSKHPSIDFNHTGDGKTVAGSTPHLYAAWSAGATGAGKGIRFRKATYSGGTWTWGAEREIDSTSYANAGRVSSVFDGTRHLIAYADSASTSSIKVRERDAADTTTTTRTPTALSDGVVTGVSVAHDGTDLYLLASGATSADPKHVKYDRAGDTWGSWTAFAATTAQADAISASRVGGSVIDVVYTSGTGSPYSVDYDSISLTEPPNTGTASGSLTLGGTAVGFTPPNSGTATGSLVIGGSAIGVTTPLVPSGSATGTLALGGVAVGLAPDQRFTPPVFEERMPATAGRLFSFFTQTMSYAVVWRNGHYQTVRVPSQEETDLLVEGRTWFSGGRSYDVDADTATLLVADGFEVT